MIALLPGVAWGDFLLTCRLIIRGLAAGGESRCEKLGFCRYWVVQGAGSWMLWLCNDVLLGALGVAIDLFEGRHALHDFENAIDVERLHPLGHGLLADFDGGDVFEN